MKAEEKVAALSEELKEIVAEIKKNMDRWNTIDSEMEMAYDTGDYDFEDVLEMRSSKILLDEKRTKLSKRHEKLVIKLRRIIARRKVAVDDEIAGLLK